MSEEGKLRVLWLSIIDDIIAISMRHPHGMRDLSVSAPLLVEGPTWEGMPDAIQRDSVELLRIVGVIKVTWSLNHGLTVIKAPVFGWDEVLPGILDVVLGHIPLPQREPGFIDIVGLHKPGREHADLLLQHLMRQRNRVSFRGFYHDLAAKAEALGGES